MVSFLNILLFFCPIVFYTVLYIYYTLSRKRSSRICACRMKYVRPPGPSYSLHASKSHRQLWWGMRRAEFFSFSRSMISRNTEYSN